MGKPLLYCAEIATQWTGLKFESLQLELFLFEPTFAPQISLLCRMRLVVGTHDAYVFPNELLAAVFAETLKGVLEEL